jgi:hypothetical protein
MRFLLVNVPHPAIGSRIPDDHLPPLGLLNIGGPLIDDGHEVKPLDAEFGPMPIDEIVSHITQHLPSPTYGSGLNRRHIHEPTRGPTHDHPFPSRRFAC